MFKLLLFPAEGYIDMLMNKINNKQIIGEVCVETGKINLAKMPAFIAI